MSDVSISKPVGPGLLISAGSVARFFFALSLSLAAIFTRDFIVLAGILIIGLSAVFAWKGTLRGAFKMGLAVLPLAVFIFILHLFIHSGAPLLKIWFLKVTLEGVIAGLLYGLKLYIYAMAGYIIFAAVDPFGLLLPLERLARKLGPAGQLFSGLAIAFFLALRFLPELTAQGRRTVLALRARGLDMKGNLFHRARVMLFVAAPLFVSGFKRADLAASALEIKGYGTRYLRAVFAPFRINPGSLALFVISILIIIAGIQAR